MAEEKLVPKLRFRGFGDEWNEFKLGEIGSFKNGVNKSKDDFGHGFPFINLEDIFNKDVLKKDEYGLVNVSNKELKEYDLKKGDVLFVRSSVKPEGVGLTTVVSEDLVDTVYSGFIIRFREEKQFIHDDFKKYCFKIRPFRNSLMSMSTTSANTNINQDSLNKLKIKVPTLNEQKKIGSFLNLIDIKLDLLHNKHKSYVNFKKYLMQQIFAQKLRFDENESSWNIMKIESLISEYKEKAGNNNFPVLSSTLSGIYLQSDYFDKNVNSEDTKDYKIVPKGYFTYRSMSDTGVFRFNIQNIVEKGIISPAYPVFTTTDINDIFLEQYLNNSSFIKRQILTLKEGGTRYALGLNKFKKLKIEVPSINEQNKIAACFETIDNKINNVYAELNFVNDFKKGLLQQMFI